MGGHQGGKKVKKGKVYFIGAGPGDPELITFKGKRCLEQADLIIYAGSLVPRGLIKKSKAKAIDSSSLTLDDIHRHIKEAVEQGKIVARVHSGDPSIYGAIDEQIRLLKRDNIPYEIIPGVTAAFALAAEAGISLTVPEITQTVIFTRISGRTPVPEREALRRLASHNATIAIYLSVLSASVIKEELIKGGYKRNAQVIIGYRIGWPEQKIIRCRLDEMDRVVKEEEIKRQAIFLIIPEAEKDTSSRLYSPDFFHGFRKG